MEAKLELLRRTMDVRELASMADRVQVAEESKSARLRGSRGRKVLGFGALEGSGTQTFRYGWQARSRLADGRRCFRWKSGSASKPLTKGYVRSVLEGREVKREARREKLDLGCREEAPMSQLLGKRPEPRAECSASKNLQAGWACRLGRLEGGAATSGP